MISRAQLLRRKERIGSSDSPAIVGVDPWRNPGDIYVEKTLEVEDAPARDAIEIGNDFERPLLRWASRELGLEIQENVEALHPDGLLAANHDALATTKPQGLEAKTGTGTDYGTPETDEVPERVIVQCQHQMYVSELELVWVPVLVAKFDRLERVMYKVQRNEKLIGLIVERDAAFWEDHVLPRIPPENFPPSLAVLRRVRRVPDTLAVLDLGMVESWRSARDARKVAERFEDERERELIAALGDAAGADFGDTKKILTYHGHSFEAVDVKRLKAERPDLAAAFSKTITVSPSLREVNRK